LKTKQMTLWQNNYQTTIIYASLSRKGFYEK